MLINVGVGDDVMDFLAAFVGNGGVVCGAGASLDRESPSFAYPLAEADSRS